MRSCGMPTGRFDVVRDADAGEAAALARRLAALREAAPVGDLEHAIKIAGKIAAVVGEPERRCVWQPLVGDEIAPPDLDPIDLEPRRGDVERAFHRVGRFGASGAAKWRGRHRVGQRALDRDASPRHVVDRGHDAKAVGHRHERDRIGADIAEDLAGISGDAAIGIEAHAHAGDHVAALIVGQERLGAGAGPAHRAADLAGRDREDRLLGREIGAGAEAAADIGADDFDFVALQSQCGGKRVALPDRALAAGDHLDDAARRVEIDDDRTRLHLRADDALIDVCLLDHQRRAGNRLVGCLAVAEAGIDGEVAGDVFVDAGRAVAQRRFRIRDRRQFVVAHRHAFRRVMRGGKALGDDEDDRLAQIAHTVGRHRQMGDVDGGIAGKGAERALGVVPRVGRIGEMSDRLAAGGDVIGAGDDGEHARLTLGLGRVDGDDARVRVGRAHEYGMAFAGQCEVVGETPIPPDEAKILEPHHRPADEWLSRSWVIGHPIKHDDARHPAALLPSRRASSAHPRCGRGLCSRAGHRRPARSHGRRASRLRPSVPRRSSDRR